MRKLKLLFAAAALLLGIVSVSAQEEDYTSYITNADLSSKDGWTLTQTTTDPNNVWSDVDGTAPSFVLEAYAGWGSLTMTEYSIKQNVTLPSGKYRAEGYAFYRYGESYNVDPLVSNAKFVAGDFSSKVVTLGSVSLDETLTSYPNSRSQASEAFTNGYYKSEVEFAIESESTIEFGYEGNHTLMRSWFIAGPIKLYRTGDFDYSLYQSQLEGLVEDAKALKGQTMAASISDALDAIINTYDGQTCTSVAEYNAAYAAINTAVSNAETSIASYALIANGVIATNDLAGWTCTNSNKFQVNTWSNEGATDGTNMGTPFIENWVGSGGQLGAGKIFYKLEGLEPGEKYAVSARIRVLREDGGQLSDVTYYVNNATKAFLANSTTCTNGQYGVFLLIGEVDDNGVLEFGIQIPEGNVNNWISFKDVSIQESTGQLVTGITLSESSLNLKYTETETLTATVAPDNADDKTYTWSTSEATVATVSGAGVVTAVGIGSATITCTANDGSGVSASCSVTVSDVDAVAAPANVSEVAAGKFLIINAALGKALGGANSYGTQASLIEHAAFATLVVDGDNYKITNLCSSTNGLGANGYVDNGSPVALTFTQKANGAYTMVQDGKYVTAQYGSTVVSMNGTYGETALAQWYLIDEETAKKNLVGATSGNPVDVTYYIGNPNFSRNVTNTWTITANNKNLAGGRDYNQCAESWQSSNGFELTQTLTVPNGTYKLRAQAAASGNYSNVFVFANDETTPFMEKGSEGSMNDMSDSFSAGSYFTDWVEVTVTDHTLIVGARTTETTSWCLWDNFELYMTSYIPVTAIDATIDRDDDTETEGIQIEEGNTGNINATITPTPASFDALTYTSSDEEIATVSDEGVVTAVAEGIATITIAAEMENVNTTLEINVVKPAVLPTTVELNETEIELTAAANTATLTATVGAEGAPQTVVWTSSNEAVATVADGVVTGVTPGTATIRATAYGYDEVYAEATVTVIYPESEYATSSYTNEGATRTVCTFGENLIKNGSFEYPNALYGWKTIGYTTDAVASDFTITTSGGVNDGTYITTNGGGTGSEKTLRRSFAVEAGKTYYFCVYTSGKAPTSSNFQYNALFAMSNATTEVTKLKEFEWPQGAGNTTTEWNKTEFTFTATTGYVGVRMGWNETAKFDNFVLAEVLSTITEGNVDYATAAIPTANIGEGAFQYSQDAVDAANDLVQGEATVEDVEAAYDALTTLNAPDADKLYNVINVTNGYAYNGKALTFMSAKDADLSANTTTMGWLEEPGSMYPQGVKFTAVEGTKNGYTMSYTRADGNEVYISTGKTSGLGNNTAQIRPTTDATKALTVVVTSADENKWYLLNTEDSHSIGATNGQTGFYTNGGSNKDVQIQEAVNNEYSLSIAAANKYGTIIVPFDAEIPTGVTVYSVNAADGDILTLDAVDAIEANTPYIVYAKEGATATLEGLGAAYTDASFTEGWLTGVYTATPAPVGSYVLQKIEGKVGFYKVAEGKQPTVGANRCYLTWPEETGGARAFFFPDGGETTGIDAIDALVNGEATIYNVSGAQIPTLQKGMNIIKTKDGAIRKVMVK